MHETDTYEVTGTLSELARLLGCESNEVMRCATELKETKTADVTLGNGSVTLMSRRLKRELSVREKTRLRVQKSRSNADVTPQSNKSEVISNSFSTEKDVADVKKVRKKKGVTEISDAFFLTDEMRSWFSENCPTVNADEETDAFIERCKAKGTEYKDWTAGWRTQMKNAEKWAREKRGISTPSELPKMPNDFTDYVRPVRIATPDYVDN